MSGDDWSLVIAGAVVFWIWSAAMREWGKSIERKRRRAEEQTAIVDGYGVWHTICSRGVTGVRVNDRPEHSDIEYSHTTYYAWEKFFERFPAHATVEREHMKAIFEEHAILPDGTIIKRGPVEELLEGIPDGVPVP